MILASLKPYYYYLIAEGKKTIEVRKSGLKNLPQDIVFYMSKDKKSFAKIPKEYQEKYRRHFGKVGLKFVCDKVLEWKYLPDHTDENECEYYIVSKDGHATCLTYDEIENYGKGKPLYGWHISDLKIYDKPKELGEFYKPLKYDEDGVICGTKQEMSNIYEWDCETVFNKKYTECTLTECPQLQKFYRLNRPPQSWYYVEEL